MATLNENDLEKFDDRLSILERAVAGVEEVLTRIEHRLFGNGQPGELTRIVMRLSDVELKCANFPEVERVSKLELEYAKMAGKAEANSGWWKTVQPIVMAIIGAALAVGVGKLTK